MDFFGFTVGREYVEIQWAKFAAQLSKSITRQPVDYRVAVIYGPPPVFHHFFLTF